MAYFILAMLGAFTWLACETKCFTIRLVVGKVTSLEVPAAPVLPEERYYLRSRHRGSRVFIPCLLVVSLPLIVLFLSPAILKYFVFQMPGFSESFDCDDSALLMVERLSQLGVTATPILGNLKIDTEAYLESDHVWVLANIFGLSVALDWGTPRFDRQHYEGYTLTSPQLLFFVEQDLAKTPGLNVLPASP